MTTTTTASQFRPVHVSAPSKIILHGEHAVVYGKTAVAASIGLRTRMTLTPSPGGGGPHHIRLHFPDVQLEDSWSKAQVDEILAKRPPPRRQDGGGGAGGTISGSRKRKNSETCLTKRPAELLEEICWFATDQIDAEYLLEICNFLKVEACFCKYSMYRS